MAVSPPRPTQRRQRPRAAKLPKMNNSERGKYYRAKYREYEEGLEQSVSKLQKQVHDLELFLQLRDKLAHFNPSGSYERVVASIFEYFVRARDGLRIESSFHFGASRADATLSHAFFAASQAPSGSSSFSSNSSSTNAFSSSSRFLATVSTHEAPFSTLHSGTHHHTSLDLSGLQSMMQQIEDQEDTTLFFELASFQVEGSRTGPVIIMHGELRTQYTRAAVEQLFPHLIQDELLLDALLDKEVRYPCAYHFYVGVDGGLHGKIVEADYLYGLQQAMGSLVDVRWLLDGAHRLKRRHNSLEDLVRGPPSMALEFIMT